VRKIYCYVDETGQDTKGRFFLVSVVILEGKLRKRVEEKLLDVEKRSKRGCLKWNKSRFSSRIAYLKDILEIPELRESLFFSSFWNSNKYRDLIAYTIAEVANKLEIKTGYKLTVLIDGLSKKDEKIFSQKLRILGIKFWKVRGLKDENSNFIRLADTLAGFLRDWIEKKDYTKNLYRSLVKKGFIKKIYFKKKTGVYCPSIHHFIYPPLLN